jgi:hypothetical protein
MKAAALAAAFLFSAPVFAQKAAAKPANKPFAPKIQTPSTNDELNGGAPAGKAKPAAEVEEAPAEESAAAPAPRRLQQHSVAIGLGQTFLLGNYKKHGDDKITMDLFYAYAASYSFDVIVNAHWSTHEDGNERMRVAGLTGGIKSRLFEFDNFSPFVMGGLGFYNPRARRAGNNDTRWTESKLTFGANFGGGVDLRLNDEWTVGALGQMHWPFKTKQDDQSDLKGYYFKMLLTLAYHF